MVSRNRAQLFAGDLMFPTGIAFDDDGEAYVTESGLNEKGIPAGGQVLHCGADGERRCLASGLRAPVTGLCFHSGSLYVSEGGKSGRISRIDLRTGLRTTVLDHLPAGGDYHTNTPLIVDDWLYFGQGAATNSGIVSWDPMSMPWTNGRDLAYDLPGLEIELAGDAVGSGIGSDDKPVTGAFQPFGTSAAPGTRLPPQLPCTSAVMRCRLDGSELQLVAWGLRNPYGLGMSADRRLLAIDLGMNNRGCRPVRNTRSCLFEVRPDVWYGWPDFAGGEAVTSPGFRSHRNGAPLIQFLLTNHNQLGRPADPLFQFPVHAGPTHFVVEPHSGDLLITLFGDKRPLTGEPGPQSGRMLVRLNLQTRTMTEVATPFLHRPIHLAWDTDRTSLFVVDFGEYEIDAQGGVIANKGSGCIWQLPMAGIEQVEAFVQDALH